MKRIKLSQGYKALVDDEDFDYLNQYNWYYLKAPKDSYGYAVCSTPPLRNKKMHRVILGAKKGQVVDHKNHSGIDNRKNNISIVSISENNFNRRVKNKTGFKGIGKIGNSYIARISYKNKRYYLGSFPVKSAAIRAYNKAKKKYYGI